MTFRYDVRIVPFLQQFGLENIARVAELNINRSLITVLVERWRPETHSFHMPTGEITVTLQDVSCLWGLPINGAPVIFFADDSWDTAVLEAFGRDDISTGFARPPGTFHLRMDWLREPWVPATTRPRDIVPAVLPADANEEQILFFARAYMMDLLGSVMFPDHSGFIYSMFVHIIYSESPRIYSWASAVLAYLYRGLDVASRATQEIAVPLILLQMWAWTRFPVSRPIRHPFPDGLAGAPYGLFWLVPHDFSDTARYSISTYRREFEELVDADVNWTPYDNNIMNQLPEICREAQEMRLWFYEGPLIWYWIVEMYTPRRAMRQV